MSKLFFLSLGEMPKNRRVLDKGEIIQLFAVHLARQNNTTPERYLADPMLLDRTVQANKSFPWQEIATQLNLDRWRLYHWYFETFQRTLSGTIERDDLLKIKEMIRGAMEKDLPLDKPFQNQIKNALTKEYHRSSFSIAFNNAKRQVMKELGKTEVPHQRPVIVSQPVFQSQQPLISIDQDDDLLSQILSEVTITESQQSFDSCDFENISHLTSANIERDDIGTPSSGGSFSCKMINFIAYEQFK